MSEVLKALKMPCSAGATHYCKMSDGWDTKNQSR
jgi:hypothetical protein